MRRSTNRPTRGSIDSSRGWASWRRPRPPAEPTPGQATSQAVVSSAEVERLGARVRRLEMIAGVLAVAVVVLAVIAVSLLVR